MCSYDTVYKYLSPIQFRIDGTRMLQLPPENYTITQTNNCYFIFAGGPIDDSTSKSYLEKSKVQKIILGTDFMRFFSLTLDFDKTEITWELKSDSKLTFEPQPSTFGLIILIIAIVLVVLLILVFVLVRWYQVKKRQDMEKIERLYLDS